MRGGQDQLAGRRSENWVERGQRRALEVAAVARRTSVDVPVQLLNLSYGGCCFEVGAGFQPTEQFLLVVPRLGRIAAEVRWSHSGRVGVMFLPAADARQARES